MSRTYKDKKWKLRFPEDDWNFGKEEVPSIHVQKNWYTGEISYYASTCTMEVAGAKPKKKRVREDQYHFPYSTPSWWVHDFMTVPKRAKCRIWEKDLVKLQDIEDAPICPDYGNKPHMYYW